MENRNAMPARFVPAINDGQWARTGRHTHQHESGVTVTQLRGGIWSIFGGAHSGERYRSLSVAQWYACRS